MEPHAEPARLSLDDPAIARLVVASARDYAIILFDEAGAIRSWSPGAELIFGYGPEETVGRKSDMLFLPADVAAGAPAQELDTARRLGRAEDSRWHLRKNGHRFWGNGLTMPLDDGPPRGFLKILRDETRAKLADEQRVLLLNELNHRIKNTLTTVQSIAELTLRAAKVDTAVRNNLHRRLLALSQAHDVLVQESWAGAGLHAVMEQALAPYRHTEADAFIVDGPPVRLSPQQALSLSLVLHELITNALKYGALSRETGRVEIAWNLSMDSDGRRRLNLLWAESGGPPVHAPEETGFGARLISRSFGRESGGRAQLQFDPAGLRCVIELPLSSPDEIPILDLSAAGRGSSAAHGRLDKKGPRRNEP